jgi:hypothetical protein
MLLYHHCLLPDVKEIALDFLSFRSLPIDNSIILQELSLMVFLKSVQLVDLQLQLLDFVPSKLVFMSQIFFNLAHGH